MATFIKIDERAAVIISAVVLLAGAAFFMPEQTQSFIDGIATWIQGVAP